MPITELAPAVRAGTVAAAVTWRGLGMRNAWIAVMHGSASP